MSKFNKLSRAEMKKITGGVSATCNTSQACGGTYFDGRMSHGFSSTCSTGPNGCGCYYNGAYYGDSGCSAA